MSKKPRRRVSSHDKSYPESDSDDVEAFTEKFMSQVKKISPEDVMTLKDVDQESDDTTDSETEQNKLKVFDGLPRGQDRGMITNRLIDTQYLAGDTSGEEDGSTEEEEEEENEEEESAIDEDGSDSDSVEQTNTNMLNKINDGVFKEDDSLSDEKSSDTCDSDTIEDTDKSISVKMKTATKQLEMDSSKTANESTFKNLRQELADVSFADLQKLKEKIGIKAYNKAMFGGSGRSQKKVFRRENKNRPVEMSSKRPVPRHREVIPVKKKVYRDPRFDDLSGEYDERIFKQAYSFLTDIKQREKQKLIKLYEKEKDTDKKKQIEHLIKRMNNQEKAEREKEIKRMREKELRKKELELIKQGKKPYFLKKVDKRKIELAEKFRELKKSGKVEKYLAKRRKKRAAKDRRFLPNKH